MEVEHEDGEMIDTTGNLCMKGMASAQRQLNEMTDQSEGRSDGSAFFNSTLCGVRKKDLHF